MTHLGRMNAELAKTIHAKEAEAERLQLEALAREELRTELEAQNKMKEIPEIKCRNHKQILNNKHKSHEEMNSI